MCLSFYRSEVEGVNMSVCLCMRVESTYVNVPAHVSGCVCVRVCVRVCVCMWEFDCVCVFCRLSVCDYVHGSV